MDVSEGRMMNNRILLKTNLLICVVIVAGFLLTAVFTYRDYYLTSIKRIEDVSNLTSEDIYYQIKHTLSKPLNTSLTMANDHLLKTYLKEEKAGGGSSFSVDILWDYLRTYHEKYGYDTVFLISAETSRYFNFSGADRILDSSAPEDAWYYNFLKSDAEYEMNVDNDQDTGEGNDVMLFVNCKIYDGDKMLGVVGVGVRIGSFQRLLQNYKERFGVSASLVDCNGLIEISADHTGFEKINIRDRGIYDESSMETLLNWNREEEPLSFWVSDADEKVHVVARYLSGTDWHLVVEQDNADMVSALKKQILLNIVIVAVVVLTALFIVIHLLRSFNRQIVSMERSYEQERQTMFEKVTGQLFENIYFLDITNNRPADEATEQYFVRLGAPVGTPFDRCLRIVAEKQIKPEFRQGYIDTFTPEHVRKVFRQGITSLRYDFMISDDGKSYYWMRITGRLVESGPGGTLYLFSYRQNIDAEKQRENKMEWEAHTDAMTGFLNKAAVQENVEEMLRKDKKSRYVFFIFDIDNFKGANDKFGHAFGDKVIQQFAGTIRSHFRGDDTMGRIGGDEFIVFVKIKDAGWALRKAKELSGVLNRDCIDGNYCWHMSASIGLAFAPEDGITFQELYRKADAALYETKRKCKGGYSVAGGETGENW